MMPIIVSPKTESEAGFILELLKKLNLKSRQLSENEMEDIGMAMLMKESDRSEKVSREEIFGKLDNES